MASQELKPSVVHLHRDPACCDPSCARSSSSGHSARFPDLSQGKTGGLSPEGRRDLGELLMLSQLSIKTGGPLAWRGSYMSQVFAHCYTQPAPHTLLAPAFTPPPGWNGDIPGLLWTSALRRGGLSGWERHSPCLLRPAAIYSSNLLPLFISEGRPGFPAASPQLTSCQWPSITGIRTHSTLNHELSM